MLNKIFLILFVVGLITVAVFYKSGDQAIKFPTWGDDGKVVLNELLNKKNLTTFPVSYENDSLVASISGFTVLFPKVGDYPALVQALQTILTTVTIEERIKVIDLRFDKPVLRE